MTTELPGKVAVIGTTIWGTTLAVVIARKGLPVALWARTAEEAVEMNAAGANEKRLSGIPFPPSLSVSADLAAVLDGAEVAIVAVPSQTVRANIRIMAPYLQESTIVVSAAKGLELGSRLRMSQVMREELPEQMHDRCAVLSGPNISLEIAQGLPAATVIAAENLEVAAAAQNLVMTPRFRVYTSQDVVGVELGGTLKNIVAMGAGLNDGLGYGANTKAVSMTRGLAEITRLGVAAGANPFTFLGLAGLGDLVVTCTSPHSRNRRVGEELTKGRPLQEILATLVGTAEGITTTVAANELSKEMGVEMPITEATYRVLYEGLDPRQAIVELMAREPKNELEGLTP